MKVVDVRRPVGDANGFFDLGAEWDVDYSTTQPAIVTFMPGETERLIGVQIIGPEYSDLKLIALAQMLETTGFAFTPPPDY